MSAQVNGKDLPLGDFGVQRPIELVEKELTDTVYYTREVTGAQSTKGCVHGLLNRAGDRSGVAAGLLSDET